MKVEWGLSSPSRIKKEGSEPLTSTTLDESDQNNENMVACRYCLEQIVCQTKSREFEVAQPFCFTEKEYEHLSCELEILLLFSVITLASRNMTDGQFLVFSFESLK